MKWKTVIPIVILGLGILVARLIVSSRPEVERQTPEVAAPVVRVLSVERGDHQFRVHAQGTVMPRTESALVPEISGRVVWVAPSFVNGGFFAKGDVLLRVAPDDYEAAVAGAKAQVAAREVQLAREEEEAAVARAEWARLQPGSAASPLVTRQPQLADARAQLAAAKATLAKAERDLERTRLRAPYDGRVRQKNVDVGGFVTPGGPAAQIYAVDVAEVRLPLPDRELQYVDLPLHYRGETRESGPTVELNARFAGEWFSWRGSVVRTEGEIDPRTRMVHVVAQVKDPYARGENPDRPPLSVGLFVEADIAGRSVADVAILPRSALRNGDTLLVVDEESRLRIRPVEVLRLEGDRAVIGAGVTEGERICVSPLESVVDGMRVQVHEGQPESPTLAETGGAS